MEWSLDFEKLVAWYKTCNKTQTDQQKMIYKRDRQERSSIPSNGCCMIRQPKRGLETTRKKKMKHNLAYGGCARSARGSQNFSVLT